MAGAGDKDVRSTRLLPWFYRDLTALVTNKPLPPRTMADLDSEVPSL